MNQTDYSILRNKFRENLHLLIHSYYSKMFPNDKVEINEFLWKLDIWIKRMSMGRYDINIGMVRIVEYLDEKYNYKI